MSHRLLLVSLSTLALAACVDDGADSGLTVLRNVAPASGCVISPDSTDFQPSGLIQANSPNGYLFTPVARNDLAVAVGESETQKVIFVEGAHVTINFFDEALFTKEERATFVADGLTRFAVPTSGGIDPDGGLATYGFEIVPAELLAMIGARLPEPSASDLSPSTLLDITVQLYGTRAGSSIESNVFRYPVEVCDDCLKSVLGVCEGLPDGFMGLPGGACNVLQDDALECCTLGASEICPAAKPPDQT